MVIDVLLPVIRRTCGESCTGRGLDFVNITKMRYCNVFVHDEAGTDAAWSGRSG